MKDCAPQIVSHTCEAKANYDFKSSLFYQKWSSFGARAEEPIAPTDIPSQRVYDNLRVGSSIRIYALLIPKVRANCSLIDLRLLQDFRLHAIAMETDDGVIVNLRGETELVLGATLWVAFELESDHAHWCQEFLGYVPFPPFKLKAKSLELSTFLVSKIPKWIGKDIRSTDMRGRHGIHLLGEYQIGHQLEKNSVNMDNNKIFFPSVGRQLEENSVLLVLRSDMHKLEELAASSVATCAPSQPADSSTDGVPQGRPPQTPPQGSR